MILRILSYSWLLFTLFILLKPGLGFHEVVFFEHEDKAAHFVLFFNLTYLWHYELGTQFGLDSRKTLKLAFVFGLIFAGFTEVAQKFIPNRGMDILDFLFNMAGVGIGLLFVIVKEKTRETLFNFSQK